LDNRNEVKELIFGSLLGVAKLEMYPLKGYGRGSPRGLNARFGFILSLDLDKKEYFLSV
jgi:hypothetical protein